MTPDEFDNLKRGDRIKIVSPANWDDYLTVGVILEFKCKEDTTFLCRDCDTHLSMFKGYSISKGVDFWIALCHCDVVHLEPVEQTLCECGAHKVLKIARGQIGHSSWCPWSKS